ncbi:hypothetical protein [Rubripirellula tenax]|uniref:hypothetical protein n=1 Tax=Rubripirellula tenax TaxID=2528015 RepID=UPI0011B53B46|nr:hypothetical protein [Rubripirellula tenax]
MFDDDLNPWSNLKRWERRPIRDRIDNSKERFAWWVLAKWLIVAGCSVAISLPWLFVFYRSLRKLD